MVNALGSSPNHHTHPGSMEKLSFMKLVPGWGRGFRGEDQTRLNRLCSRVPEDNTGCGPEPAGAQTNHTLGTRRKPTEGLQTALAGLGVLSGL